MSTLRVDGFKLALLATLVGIGDAVEAAAEKRGRISQEECLDEALLLWELAHAKCQEANLAYQDGLERDEDRQGT